MERSIKTIARGNKIQGPGKRLLDAVRHVGVILRPSRMFKWLRSSQDLLLLLLHDCRIYRHSTLQILVDRQHHLIEALPFSIDVERDDDGFIRIEALKN